MLRCAARRAQDVQPRRGAGEDASQADGDDETVVVAGSFNYTQPANDSNDENLFVIGSVLPEVVDKAMADTLYEEELVARGPVATGSVAQGSTASAPRNLSSPLCAHLTYGGMRVCAFLVGLRCACPASCQ
jgi:hypothetical protein